MITKEENPTLESNTYTHVLSGMEYLELIGLSEPIKKSKEKGPLMSAEEQSFIVEKVNELSPFKKGLIRLVFWENYTLSEVSAHWNIPPHFLEQAYQSSLEWLKQKYFEEFKQKPCFGSFRKEECHYAIA